MAGVRPVRDGFDLIVRLANFLSSLIPVLHSLLPHPERFALRGAAFTNLDTRFAQFRDTHSSGAIGSG